MGIALKRQEMKFMTSYEFLLKKFIGTKAGNKP
jgi:hypothetical protein